MDRVLTPSGELLSMRDFPGAPGSLGGLALRLGQSLFAAASVFFIVGAPHSYGFTTFYYLTAAMTLQFIWSITLAAIDMYALLLQRGFHKPIIMGLFVVGDWVIATLSLASASATAGLIILLDIDTNYCIFSTCWRYQMADVMAFLSWVAVATSALLTLWILASS